MFASDGYSDLMTRELRRFGFKLPTFGDAIKRTPSGPSRLRQFSTDCSIYSVDLFARHVFISGTQQKCFRVPVFTTALLLILASMPWQIQRPTSTTSACCCPVARFDPPGRPRLGFSVR